MNFSMTNGRAMPSALPRWAALSATALCVLFYFGLPFSTGASNTAGAVLVILTLVCARWLRCELAKLDSLLLLAVLCLPMTALVGSVVAIAGGYAPWKIVGLHRKELVFIALLLWLSVLPVAGLVRRALWAGTALTIMVNIGLWGMDQSLGGGPFNPLVPVSLTHAFHNFMVATVCLWMLVYVVEEWTVLNWTKRVLIAAVGLVGLCTVLLVNSGRTAQLATVLMVGAYAAQRLSRRAALSAVLALGVGLLALAYLPTPFGERLSKAFDDVHAFESGQQVSPVGLRLLFVETSVDLIRERPLLGYGTGSYRAVQDAHLGIPPMSEKSAPHPHNDLLHLWVERGILGPAALLFVYIALWRAGARLLAYRRIFLRAVLIAFFVASLANSFYMDWASGSFLLGLAALLLCADRQQAAAPPGHGAAMWRKVSAAGGVADSPADPRSLHP